MIPCPICNGLRTEADDIPPFLLRKNWTTPVQPAPAAKPIIWSYTLLNTYRSICPHQMFRRYLKKDIPYVETEAMRRGNEVHTAFELRVGGGKPLPPAMAAYEPFAAVFDGRGAECETKLGITRDGRATSFFDKDVWGRGKTDCVVRQGTTAYICDWKTGKVREDPFELEIGALLLRARWPDLTKIVGQYCWLGEQRMGPLHDLSDTGATWAVVQQIMASIENDRIVDEFAKQKSGLCGWCDVRDCEFNRK